MDEELEKAMRLAAHAIAAQFEAVESELLSDFTGDEDDITSQLVGRIKAAMSLLQGPVAWSATSVGKPTIAINGRHLTSRGKGAEESKVGADIVIVVNIDLPGYKVVKGLLVQAKRVSLRGEVTANAERVRLLKQCDLMLTLTPASFVWTYGNAVRVFSASATRAAKGMFSSVPHTWSAEIFFFDFFCCWIGDPRIDSTSPPSLSLLMEQFGAHEALLIQARSREHVLADQLPS